MIVKALIIIIITKCKADFAALECNNPLDIKMLSQQVSEENEGKQDTATIYQKTNNEFINAQQCKVSKTTLQYYCGHYSASKIASISTEVPQIIEPETCRKITNELVFTAQDGSDHKIKEMQQHQ